MVITFLWWTPFCFPLGYSWAPLSLSFSFYYGLIWAQNSQIPRWHCRTSSPSQHIDLAAGYLFHFLLGLLSYPGLHTHPEWAPPWVLQFVITLIPQRLSGWSLLLLKHSGLKICFPDSCIIESYSNKQTKTKEHVMDKMYLWSSCMKMPVFFLYTWVKVGLGIKKIGKKKIYPRLVYRLLSELLLRVWHCSSLLGP